VGAMAAQLRVRAPVDDIALSALHAHAFAIAAVDPAPWSERLERHSLLWVTAEEFGRLIGFVNVIGDGGKHAVLLDTVVDPTHQGHGLGQQLVEAAAKGAREAGYEWLHVDFEDDLADFYLRVCGFDRTAAGLRRLA
jgi:GNAT superfamily N-acetyltransferase